MKALTFTELAGILPVADFLRLQAQISDPECAKYVRKITGTKILDRSNDGNRKAEVGIVTYVPQTGGKFEDPGEIPTNWISNDAVARMIGNIAEQNIGSMCLIFQLNKDKSDEQPSGFREIVWLQPLDRQPSSTSAQSTYQAPPRDDAPPPEPRPPMNAAEDTTLPDSQDEWMASQQQITYLVTYLRQLPEETQDLSLIHI